MKPVIRILIPAETRRTRAKVSRFLLNPSITNVISSGFAASNAAAAKSVFHSIASLSRRQKQQGTNRRVELFCECKEQRGRIPKKITAAKETTVGNDQRAWYFADGRPIAGVHGADSLSSRIQPSPQLLFQLHFH